MATLVARPAVTSARSQVLAYERLRLLAGIPLLIGTFLSFLGFGWDVQWHVDVGPDTFFTLPHLVLYSGTALAGLTSLLVVLLTTFRYQDVADDSYVVLGGRFRGPVGYLISGTGAGLFLAYGLVDQWWHDIYGFDVTLVSPPHVGLVLAILTSMVGCLCTFAVEVRRAEMHGRSRLPSSIGFAIAAVLLFAFVTPSAVDVTTDVAASFGLPVASSGPLTFLYALLLLLSAVVLRRPGAATLVALVMTLLRLGLWVTIPWVTAGYATTIGLFLRDNSEQTSIVAGVLPPYLLLAGIAVDLVLLLGRRLGWNVRLTVLLSGALVPVALTVITSASPPHIASHSLFWVRPNLLSLETLTSVSPVLIVVGALAGMLGWMVGFVLRNQDPSDLSARVSAPVSAMARP